MQQSVPAQVPLRYEYFVPGLLFFTRNEQWAPIRIQTESRRFSLLMPEWPEPQPPDGPLLVFPVSVECPSAEPMAFWPWVRACVAWVQVATSQHKIGTADGFSVRSRGQVIAPDGSTSGFGMATFEINGEVLNGATWDALGAELSQGKLPRASDLLFVDALRAYAEGKVHQSLLFLGVAAELEVNALIADLVSAHQDLAVTELYRLSARSVGFARKLEKLAPALGALPFVGRRPNALEEIKRLYDMRGTAAHTDSISGAHARLPVFFFAFEDLRGWARDQRARLGIAQPAPAPGRITAIPGPA